MCMCPGQYSTGSTAQDTYTDMYQEYMSLYACLLE